MTAPSGSPRPVSWPRRPASRWPRHSGLDDGVRMLRDVLDGLDALDAALSKPPVAAAAAAALATNADAACHACHVVHREQDPDTGEYSVKLGVE